MAKSLSVKWAAVCGFAVLVVIGVGVALPLLLRTPKTIYSTGKTPKILNIPVIDGHNDLPNNFQELIGNRLWQYDFTSDLRGDPIWNCKSCFTDLPRLKEGRVAGQFWVAYVDCKLQFKDAVEATLEQIDVIKRFINKYPQHLQFADSVEGISKAINNSRIASIIGVEGGHSIGSRISILRIMYELGVRYLTLTHNCSTPWAESSTSEYNTTNKGLTEYGKNVIREMNRLGMMVDLSHVSTATMRDAIEVSRAPVIFSHSSARELCNHSRNVPDEILKLMPQNGGLVMVNFYSDFIYCSGNDRNAHISDVIDHINHIRKVAGIDHVGIGGDYDGVNKVPDGLEDVSKYPKLFELLANSEHGPSWTPKELRKLASLNLLRVFKEVEKVRESLKDEDPLEAELPTYS